MPRRATCNTLPRCGAVGRTSGIATMFAMIRSPLRSAAMAIGAARVRPSPPISHAARSGPAAKPIGAAALKSEMTRARSRSGATSRIVASITPVLPSQKPSATVAPTSCQAWSASAKAISAARAMRPLRTMTSRRDRNSAIASQIGTCGAPMTKSPAIEMPVSDAISPMGTPACSSAMGRYE